MRLYANLDIYADHVRQATGSLLAGLCRELGPEHRLTIQVADLCTEAATIVNQRQMQQEQAGEYDLGALVAVVSPDVASDSETFWEKEG